MNIKQAKSGVKRFTAYRLNMDKRTTHDEFQKNPEDEPQFEGAIFSDGTCVIRWLTPCGSHSVWKSVDDMLRIHGHPEYGTVILWHDGEAPQAWFKILSEWYIKASDEDQQQRLDRILADPT